jgi:hypothetical protein
VLLNRAWIIKLIRDKGLPMRKQLKYLGFIALLVLGSGCASTDTAKQYRVSSTSVQQQAASTQDEKLQKQIDARVDDIAKDRSSRFRLRSLFGGFKK